MTTNNNLWMGVHWLNTLSSWIRFCNFCNSLGWMMTKCVDSLKSLVATKFENQIHSILILPWETSFSVRKVSLPYITLRGIMWNLKKNGFENNHFLTVDSIPSYIIPYCIRALFKWNKTFSSHWLLTWSSPRVPAAKPTFEFDTLDQSWSRWCWVELNRGSLTWKAR